MQQIGIYEQLITQLISTQLDRNNFYIGEKEIAPAEAAQWLARFIANILEVVISSVPSGPSQLEKQIDLSNQLLVWLKDKCNDSGFIDENLIDSRGKILTAR